MVWKPGQQAERRALEAPFDDVPAHLKQPLWAWVKNCLLQDGGARLALMFIDLRIDQPPDNSGRIYVLQGICDGEPTKLLDMAELLLGRYTWDSGRGDVLKQLLTEANSAYTVRGDYRGLEMRVLPEVRNQVQASIEAAAGTSAANHLTNAWNEAYGRQPDPVKSYSESIKAVESAFAAQVTPQNHRQTLGTMIRDVKSKPEKWTFPLPGGVETVVSMMSLLWAGQTSRHGGPHPTRQEAPEEARAAVHLAATLVQYGATHSFAPVDE